MEEIVGGGGGVSGAQCTTTIAARHTTWCAARGGGGGGGGGGVQDVDGLVGGDGEGAWEVGAPHAVGTHLRGGHVRVLVDLLLENLRRVLRTRAWFHAAAVGTTTHARIPVG